MKNNLLNSILNDIDENMDEKDILTLKNKIKEVEREIKEKNKPKTITISGKDHAIIKEYCTTLNLNIGEWTSKVLLDKIESSKCYIKLEKEDFEKIEKEEVIERYINNQIVPTLYKFDKLIINKNFHFKGYSLIDGKPLYWCNDFNTNTKTLLDTNGIVCELVDKLELCNSITLNKELDIEII